MKYRSRGALAAEVEAATFEEFVTHGLTACGIQQQGGMPWSFQWEGFTVTHENDRCYLVIDGKGGTIRFTPEFVLVKDVLGELSLWSPDAFRGSFLSVEVGRLATVKPTVGRIVLYTNLGDRDGKYPPEAQAALITGVNADGTVVLHIFYRTGQFDMQSVAQTDAAAGTEEARGKWSWPPRA